MKDYITPCPMCGLHTDDSPETWACDGCIEIGVVKAKYGLDYISTLLLSGEVDKAISYADKIEFVDAPKRITEEERVFTIEVIEEDENGERIFDVTDERGESLLSSEVYLSRKMSLGVKLKVVGATQGILEREL